MVMTAMLKATGAPLASAGLCDLSRCSDYETISSCICSITSAAAAVQNGAFTAPLKAVDIGNMVI